MLYLSLSILSLFLAIYILTYSICHKRGIRAVLKISIIALILTCAAFEGLMFYLVHLIRASGPI